MASGDILRPGEVPLFSLTTYKGDPARSGRPFRLTLTSSKLSWRRDDGGDAAADKELAWSLISSVKISSAESKKHAMKVFTGGRDSFVVRFAGENARVDLVRVKEIITRKIAPQLGGMASSASASASAAGSASASAPKVDDGSVRETSLSMGRGAAKRLVGSADKIVRVRQRLLAAMDDLKESYDEMVGGGVVDAEDFWDAHSGLVAEQAAQPEAAGASNTSERAENPKIVLTAAKMLSIFKEEPHVHAEYKRLVPEHMSRKDFWIGYIRDRYYRQREAARKGGVGAAAAGDGADADGAGGAAAAEAPLDPRNIAGDAAWDLVAMYGDYYAGERDADEGGGDSEAITNITKKYHTTSRRVLAGLSGAAGKERREEALKRAREHYDMPELRRTDSAAELVPLELSAASAPAADAGARGRAFGTLHVDRLEESMREQRGFEGHLRGGDAEKRWLANYRRASRARGGAGGPDPEVGFYAEEMGRLRKQFRRACDLLGYYYVQRELRTDGAKRKTARILSSLRTLRGHIETSRQNHLVNEPAVAKAIMPIIEALDKAIPESVGTKRVGGWSTVGAPQEAAPPAKRARFGEEL